jgi:dTDP-4-amino-4,6-dideoxygalactose transaminase
MNNTVAVPFVNLGLQYLGLRDQILNAFDQISQQGTYIMGPELQTFEKNFAAYCGTEYAIGIGNGGDALFFVLKALGIGPGDEVITAANSFIASAWAIAVLGAKPVFADVRDDYNIDPDRIREVITDKTRAIMPVHLTGRPADMAEIMAIAKENDLHVIEDAAQAVGATYRNKKTGSIGTAGCFSLHPLKNLHVHGDGGMVTTNDRALYDKILLLRNHGLKNRDECVLWGHNSRLDTIQAAIADIKLKHLDVWNSRFRLIGRRYNEELGDIVTVPSDSEESTQIFHRYIITTEKRDELQLHLLKLGIETKVNYPIPLHLQECSYELGYTRGAFPVTERLAQTILSLPIYAELTDSQVGLVIDGVRSFFSKN